jgi:hypothetical protein
VAAIMADILSPGRVPRPQTGPKDLSVTIRYNCNVTSVDGEQFNSIVVSIAQHGLRCVPDSY